MSEFSDRPFVAGSLIGMRAFAVDPLGRLKGPSYSQIFKPGENVAECRRSEGGTFGFATGGMFTIPSASFRYTFDPGTNMVTPVEREPEPTEAELKERQEKAAAEAAAKEEERKKNHSLAGLTCSCGFYAYFDGRNDYKNGHTVTALIEGFGVCTVGTSGFRASKARLVALVRPGKRVGTELIERNYPDVPMYDRKRDALEHHPLTTDPLPTPDDDDFWTRGAAS